MLHSDAAPCIAAFPWQLFLSFGFVHARCAEPTRAMMVNINGFGRSSRSTRRCASQVYTTKSASEQNA
eukprot:scaffold53_cov193-Pinguiococcus_pyrenoidosus.AAC.45